MARSGVLVTIKDTGPLKLAKQVRFSGQIGLLPEDGARRHKESGLTLNELAAIHEFGSAEANIPARPWLRTWADIHLSRYTKQVLRELALMVRTQKFENTTTLQRIVDAMGRSIRGRVFGGHIRPENKTSTLARKSPETRPLLESGQMIRAFSARLRANFGLFKGRVDMKSK